MTKLKTLEDIELNVLGHEAVRKEAIKWVKNGMYTENDFKLFHNIKDEDLK